MKELDTFLFDSFTTELFGGNIAGVVLDARELPPWIMQGIASELAAPTTGFVVGATDSTFDVRFFTPSQEIAMCGHVTIAVFTALAAIGRLSFGSSGVSEVIQRTVAGDLPIQVHRKGDRLTVSMVQRRPQFWTTAVSSAELANILGIPHQGIAAEQSACGSTALRHLFVEVRGLSMLRDLRPDFSSLERLSRDVGVDTVAVYCHEVERSGSTIHLRDLCPAIGNPEEAASGTTNGALASFLVREGCVPVLNNAAEVVAEQGFEMGRPSIIHSRIQVEGKEIVEVRVSGSAVCSLRGKFVVPSLAATELM